MQTKKSKNMVGGARILMVSFILLFFILVGRFSFIQATQSAEGQMLTNLAKEKWTKQTTLEANRGDILDRNGEIIATAAPSYTVYAVLDQQYPNHVQDPKQTAEKLAQLLNMDASKLENLMSKQGLFQVELRPGGRNINEQMKAEIEALHLPGIGFIRDKKRYYPNGIFASHVIGYARKNDDNQIVGQMGVEETLDKFMQGKSGKLTYQSDRSGIKLPNPKELMDPPKNGDDVYLTIDQKIQTFLESALTSVQKEYEPEKMMAIVADPKTGEILAMANRPSFDPNKPNIQNYLNDAVAYSFEPGSTMKIFTLAAAVNEGVFNPDEKYQSGSYSVSPNLNPIRDHNGVGWGKISFLEGVQRSSNVAFSILANDKLGTDRFLTYLERFRFGQKTGIDLPQEASGDILFRYPIEKVTTSFGQGTTVTPIQLIQGATAVANQGKMMKPFILKKIVDPKTGETLKETKPELIDQPITAETAKQVRNILETVVTSPHGTGKNYKLTGYSVAGKTGTAQISDPETGRYMYGKDNYIFSFLGMAPKDDPQLLVYVAVKQPKLKPTETGSEPVSDIFRTVMKNSLHYLNVMPTEQAKAPATVKKPEMVGETIKSYIGLPYDQIKADLASKGMNIVKLGSASKIVGQAPLGEVRMLPGDKLILKTDGKIIMPNLVGWSLRDVMKAMKLLDLKPSLVGSGYVTKQSIPAGREVKKGDYLVVELTLPGQDKRYQKPDTNGNEIPVELSPNVAD